MARRRTIAGIGVAAIVLLLTHATAGSAAAQSGLSPDYLDKLLAPVALYPDALLAQMLLCSGNSRKVGELAAWLKAHPDLKGSDLQQAAEQAGFQESFVALAPFPHVVEMMARDATWTSQLGGAFAVDKEAVFDSIQRLRGQSQAAGNLKSTPQQTVETKTTSSGESVIVIEPANPQVVYVPQYNPQVVYTQPAATTTTTTTVVIKEEDHSTEAAIAGAAVGFAAGIAIGAAMDNNYYYGPYGWYGAPAMYNDAWDDWYDDREDAREDWYENREDAREDIRENRENLAEERTERRSDTQEQRTERTGNAQEQRTERQQNRQSTQTSRQGTAANAQSAGASTMSAESRGRTSGQSTTSAQRSGAKSDAFSGYSSGRSER